MEIGIIIKESCPERHERLRKIRGENKKENLTEKDIKELMHHSSYRRSRRGAIKQVR